MKYFRLQNDMKVLIVSDQESQSAAACCYVRSGALNDSEFQGLAHFCEHMLFLGTNNRPENTYT